MRLHRNHGIRTALWGGLLVLVLVGCAFGPPDETADGREPPKLSTPPQQSQPPADDGIGVQVLATGLEVPWGLAFLPDGSALVTERRSGRLLTVTPAGGVREAHVIDKAQDRGEGGLLGVAVSPHYEQDATIFLYYTTARDNRIARLRLGEKPQPIVTGIPASRNHNGGQLAFGPDGFLYASTGDAQIGSSAQNTSSLAGKILRMTANGTPAPGNPFGDSLVYSYGHRNVQGFAWDSKDRLYATEFGLNTWDEVNAITPGGNYGWPEVEGHGGRDGMIDPIVVWSTDEASPSGAAIVDNVLIVGALRGERLWIVSLSEEGGISQQPTSLLKGEYGRLRSVGVSPDGSLWITTSNRDGRGSPRPEDDRIIRLIPPGGSSVELL